LEKAGFLSDVTGCALALGDIRLVQGGLGEAMGSYERALGLVTPASGPVLRGAADMHVGIAGVLIERGDLDGGRRHLALSRDLGEHLGLPQNPYRWRVAMARVREAEGDVDEALVLLDEAEHRYVGDYFPEVRPIPALRARLHARHGRWTDALAWADGRGLSLDDELDYLHEYEHLTLARALVARFTVDGDERSLSDATRLLPRLLRAAEEGGRTGSVLDALVIQALAERARGDLPAASAALRHASTLAEPHGQVRVVLDESRYLGALLGEIAAGAPDAGGHSAPRPTGLIEPLSAREMDVLRLLGSDLDGPDIARRLFVSVNTVRTHTKNIYAKLGVNNRRAAVRRAEELDLTGQHPGRSAQVLTAPASPAGSHRRPGPR
jgi:LuxR family maltose regulon positive regulatory protein